MLPRSDISLVVVLSAEYTNFSRAFGQGARFPPFLDLFWMFLDEYSWLPFIKIPILALHDAID